MSIISERDAVTREREAFRMGAGLVFAHFRIKPGDSDTWGGSTTLAERHFPLPKVTRPREVLDKTGLGAFWWRIVDGVLEHRAANSDKWYKDTREEAGNFVFVERVKLLADLIANPTEEVEA